MMNITQIAATRYTTKAYDPHKRIGTAQMEQVQTLLRCAPSSINAQPWHFIIAGSEAGKARIAQATTGPYSANDARVRNCAHVAVLVALGYRSADDPNAALPKSRLPADEVFAVL